MRRRGVIALAGALCLGALSVASAAKDGDQLLAYQAFKSAQGVQLRNFGAKEYRRRKPSYGWLFSRKKPEFVQYRRLQRPADIRRKRKLDFDRYDPQPEKPRSPDDGFGIYQPVRLVALYDPKLDAPMPDQELAWAILHELGRSESPLRVTAQQRDAVVSFYRTNSFTPLWVDAHGPGARAARILALFARAEEEALNPLDYLPPTLGSFADDATIQWTPGALAGLDIGLTAMALRYAEHIHSGRVIPKKLSGYYGIEPPALNLGLTLHELSHRVLPDLYLSSLAPSHPAYAAMRDSLAELRTTAAHEEREPVPAGGRVNLGRRDARVLPIRARMVELGYLNQEGAMAWMAGQSADGATRKHERTLDKALSKALRAFQSENGIRQTGAIDRATIDALNSRIERGNIEKLVINMERLRWLPRELGERHILVNQAAFELGLVDRHRSIWSTRVIVGKPETQTAVFSDELETVVINPYWGVPQSIIRYEMMPRLARDRRYLDRQGFEVVNENGRVVSSRSVNWWAYGDTIPYGVRQPPGDDNALGRIKFLFPNSYDIYMHDTPTRELFAESVRAFSHGCVRVENPRELARHVMGWDRKRVDDEIASGENRKVPLDRRIPVHLNYFTAWPDQSGRIVFYPDIYNRDTRLDKALNTIAVAVN